MPTWFVILAKVLSMLSYLIPQVEQTFGQAPSSGADKKNAVMARVRDWLDSPQAAAADPGLDQQRKEAVLAFADSAVDNIVAAANAADAFPPPEVKEQPDPDVSDHELAEHRPPWEPPFSGRPAPRGRR